MTSKTLFGYIRVSTQKQGEQGVSLQEQKAAIQRYADEHGFVIVRWFEEQESAAKGGRPGFNEMLRLLKRKQAEGVIIHKIDRTARNLRDWVDFIELTDQGFELHAAYESRDLRTLGGRLISDIEAALAAHYSRNLREEVKKGMYGRLKQGLYPWKAPLGYVDNGTGRPKTIDPVRGPLIQKAFELYATGNYTLRGQRSIILVMYELGLRGTNGTKVSVNCVSKILNNPFYTGLIYMKKVNAYYEGIHQPLVSKEIFDRVQRVLRGRTNHRPMKHDHPFRLLFKCATCRYSLRGEIQKGRVYYRCHTPACPTTAVREDRVEEAIVDQLSQVHLRFAERDYARTLVDRLLEHWQEQRDKLVASLTVKLSQVNDSLNRLTDAVLDGLIDKDSFEQRKAVHLMQRKDLEQKLAELRLEGESKKERITDFFTWIERPLLGYEYGNKDEKRDLINKVWSNCQARGKKLELMPRLGFELLQKRTPVLCGGHSKDLRRTWDELFPALVDWIIASNLQVPSFVRSDPKTRGKLHGSKR